MSNPTTPCKSLLRNNSELEGALLPTAQAVVFDEEADDNTPMATAALDYSDHNNENILHGEYAERIPLAPTIPNLDTNSVVISDERLQQQLIAESARRGEIDAEEEKERIQKLNRDVYARNYYEREQVRRANELAAKRNRLEKAGAIDTSADVAANMSKIPKPSSQPPAVKAPEFYPGTYGGEYEVSKYEVGSYETSDYEVSEYKSVYESL